MQPCIFTRSQTVFARKKITSENGSRAVAILTTLAREDSCGYFIWDLTLDSRKGGVFSRYYNDDNVGLGCWIIMG